MAAGPEAEGAGQHAEPQGRCFPRRLWPERAGVIPSPFAPAHPTPNLVPLLPSPLPVADPTSSTRVLSLAPDTLFTFLAPLHLLLSTLNSQVHFNSFAISRLRCSLQFTNWAYSSFAR